jgi:hypothetical protein
VQWVLCNEFLTAFFTTDPVEFPLECFGEFCVDLQEIDLAIETALKNSSHQQHQSVFCLTCKLA